MSKQKYVPLSPAGLTRQLMVPALCATADAQASWLALRLAGLTDLPGRNSALRGWDMSPWREVLFSPLRCRDEPTLAKLVRCLPQRQVHLLGSAPWSEELIAFAFRRSGGAGIGSFLSNPCCPSAALVDAARRGVLRELVAANPNTPAETLASLPRRRAVAEALAANPSCPMEVLAELAKMRSRAVSHQLLTNPQLPSKLVGMLGRRDGWTDRALAHPNAPTEAVEALKPRPSYQLQRIAASKGCSAAVVRRVVAMTGPLPERRELPPVPLPSELTAPLPQRLLSSRLDVSGDPLAVRASVSLLFPQPPASMPSLSLPQVELAAGLLPRFGGTLGDLLDVAGSLG